MKSGNTTNLQNNRSAEITAAVVAFLGALGYLVRMISHYTYYVIKIKYSESVIYGLLPAVIVASFGVLLLLNKRSSPVLTSIPAIALTVYTVALMIANGLAEGIDGTSVISILIVLVTTAMYVLTCCGVIKTKAPALIAVGLSVALYTLLSVVTAFYYVSSGDAPESYYGYIAATVGLALFFVSIFISLFSMGAAQRKQEVEEKLE